MEVAFQLDVDQERGVKRQQREGGGSKKKGLWMVPDAKLAKISSEHYAQHFSPDNVKA